MKKIELELHFKPEQKQDQTIGNVVYVAFGFFGGLLFFCLFLLGFGVGLGL